MNPSDANDIPGAEKIIVRGVNWLGDAVMTVPALRRLREAKPRAHIALLAPEKLGGLWEGQDFLDEVILFSPTETVWQTSRRLRAQRFSTGVAFPNSIRSALELWLSGIPRRIGYAHAGRTLFLTQPVAARSDARPMRKRSTGEIRRLIAGGESAPALPAQAHHAHNYLRLAAALGASAEPLAPRLSVGQEEAAATAARLGLAGAPGQLWLGMNPGAEYGPAKRWPAENFVAAAAALHKAVGCRWVVFGGAGDVEIAQTLCARVRQAAPLAQITDLAGRTTLRELAVALKFCRVLLTNDSGPMHLAAAVGTPVVVPFGSTSPELTGPFLAANATILRAPEIPCSPCFRRECPIDFRCLRNIAPETVVEAILRSL